MSKKLVRHLESMNPQYSLLGMIFERCGGEERMINYFNDDKNYGKLIDLIMKTAPPQLPQQGIQGDVNITVSPKLSATVDHDSGDIIES